MSGQCISGHQRHIAKRHLIHTVTTLTTIILGGAVLGLAPTSLITHETVAVNFAMIFGLVGIAHVYHLVSYLDIMNQWGVRRRVKSRIYSSSSHE